MTTYLLRRILLMFPTLIGVTVVVFLVMAFSPGGFTGVVLNQFGGMAEDQDTEQIRRDTLRRYGLDQPLVVQYGRWLNQVSPIGFLTSADVKERLANDPVQIAQTREALEQTQIDWPQGTLDTVTDITLSIAAYHDTEPPEAARQVIEAMRDPATGLELLSSIDAEPDEGFKQKVTGLSESDPLQARRQLITKLSWEFNGRKKIHFKRPAIKWPDLGKSLRGRRVSQLLGERVPVTLLLNAITIPIIYGVAILTGIFAARHRGKMIDVGSGFVFLALWSVPVIWAGVMLIGYLANEQNIKLFPTGGLHDLQADRMAFLPSWGQQGFERGWLLDACWHLALPVFCLTYGGFAVLSKLTRGAILENLWADFVRTARAKGVNERDILFRHVLRNSILPLITVAASIIPSLIAGAVVVESIFSIQGMGKLAIEAAYMRDQQLFMGTILIGGAIGLVSELVRDVCYAIADPRVSYE